MTKKEFLEEAVHRMQRQVENTDTEVAHSNADDILCEVLEKLGQNVLVDTYKEVHKWYA